MIVLHEVHKTYQEGGADRLVLAGISMRIDSGEFVAVQGPSGSGKSTLLNLIAGLDRPDSGTVEVSGHDIGAMTEQQRTLFRRRHIGFVFQFFSLIPTLTVAENVGFSLELNAMDGALDARVAELLAQIDLGDRGHSYPDRLSGGEQQRVAIARAIAHSPQLVLADEPTGNLDARTQSKVLDLLRRVHDEHKTTMIIATHSEHVTKRADRTIQLGHAATP